MAHSKQVVRKEGTVGDTAVDGLLVGMAGGLAMLVFLLAWGAAGRSLRCAC